MSLEGERRRDEAQRRGNDTDDFSENGSNYENFDQNDNARDRIWINRIAGEQLFIV